MDNVIDNVIDSTLTGDEPGAIETPDGKTFSQEEVNTIIRDRLTKEKEKIQKQYEAMEKEFKQKELNLKAKELLTSKGLSLDILDALKYEDEDTLNKSVNLIESIFKTGTKPNYDPAAGGAPDPDQQIREAMGLKK
ncbi:DUF4355 domain-containing protein [Acetobacterium wieringae]|uniref:capsid assembly scaffolding protein Gp46 family protein n=1 Tax=Acetobacterium wieringae TaxID=52694 RepID=UPI002B212659|nr:DUF4355 domain-containing protein [Acetobacterium wieringae]MEA4804784.1 DUF4355 domain-containing protein [Acetobacterium wieringae]